MALFGTISMSTFQSGGYARACGAAGGRGVHHFVETITREVTGGSLLTEWCSPITTIWLRGFTPTIIMFSRHAPKAGRLPPRGGSSESMSLGTAWDKVRTGRQPHKSIAGHGIA